MLTVDDYQKQKKEKIKKIIEDLFSLVREHNIWAIHAITITNNFELYINGETKKFPSNDEIKATTTNLYNNIQNIVDRQLFIGKYYCTFYPHGTLHIFYFSGLNN